MRYIKGNDRYQLETNFVCLDDMIESNNLVRIIDYFVNNLDLIGYGFTKSIPKKTGRKPYDPKDLLKLYIYGYLNRINSSRRLEKETKRNIELKWLLGNLSPDFKTIADFRKDNRDKLKSVFKEFTFICKNAKLLDFELTAIDGSFFSAVNHNSKNYSKAKLKRLMDKVDKHIEAYLNSLSKLDKTEISSTMELSDKISKLKEEQQKYQFLIERMEESGESQISLTDPDSKMMHKRQSKTDMSYNVQTAVDAKHKLISEFEVTNDCNDVKQLTNMSTKVMETHNQKKLKVTADAGYFSGKELFKAKEKNIEAYVTIPQGDKSDRKGRFSPKYFYYNEDKDVYICPENKELPFYSFDRKNEVRIYASPKSCKNCQFVTMCASKKAKYRSINRSYFADIVKEQKQKNEQNQEIIELRKMIVEHPFGTIKHHMKLGEFLTRGLEAVNGEFSLIALAYNFKRSYNILGFERLLNAMKNYYLIQNQDNGAFFYLLLNILRKSILKAWLKITNKEVEYKYSITIV